MKTTGYFFFSIFILFACKPSAEQKGMFFITHIDKPGKAIAPGDVIDWIATQSNSKDSVLFNWENHGRPALFTREESQFKGDIYYALGRMSEGDSVVFRVSTDSLRKYNGWTLRQQGEAGPYVVYRVKIKKVFHRSDKTSDAFNAEIDSYVNQQLNALKTRETNLINSFLASNGLIFKKTPSGLFYAIQKSGTGALAQTQDTVSVLYSGREINGLVFDTTSKEIAQKSGFNDSVHTFNRLSHPYAPVKVPLGHGRVVPGLEEALLSFPEGTYLKLLIPSNMGFNDIGVDGLPPYTPLLYDLFIRKVYPAKGPLSASINN